MRLALTMLALMGALFAVSSCAVASAVHEDVVEGFCEADDGAWTLTPPPADAQAFRDTLRADQDYLRVSRQPEYWFTRADGEVRLCHTPLNRAEYTHPRWRDCDTRVATWWNFRRTEGGPRTSGAEERVCVL